MKDKLLKAAEHLKQNKKPITMTATAILCICLAMTGPTLAKWVSSSNGSSSIKIAAFAADAGSASNTAMWLSSRENITAANYTFWVTNTENTMVSEVAMEYSVIVTLPKTLPDGVTLLVDNSPGTTFGNNKTYTFSNDAWVFEPGVEKSETHTLTFQADFDTVKDDFSADEIEIRVKIEQTD